ncbi:MAG: hypothetical protein LKG25_05315 [Prevotella sp.]|jgi:hypothetical protein|nr:hypothetical protein [Prevotella sp.]MCI1281995.1 hypothetical protein [Prevotella sp.]
MGHKEKEKWEDSDVLKQRLISSSKRREIAGKVMFVILTIMAIAVVLFCLWAYLCDK